MYPVVDKETSKGNLKSVQ